MDSFLELVLLDPLLSRALRIQSLQSPNGTARFLFLCHFLPSSNSSTLAAWFDQQARPSGHIGEREGVWRKGKGTEARQRQREGRKGDRSSKGTHQNEQNEKGGGEGSTRWLNGNGEMMMNIE